MAAKRRSWLGIAAAITVVLGLAETWSFGTAAASRHTVDVGARTIGESAGSGSGSRSRFMYLAERSSNSCTLEPSALERMPDRMRLQGSCCSPMNLAAYRSQIRGLHTYRSVPQIPEDPYDVPVVLAKRLLGYDRAISPHPAQERVYRQAMRASREKGPCCCHCWRWSAFAGLSKYLIADRGWRASGVATLIDLLDGCGGPAH